jgi:hypothetical protein
MKSVQTILEKFYWLFIAASPLLPWYMLSSLQERLACAYGSPCFEHGLPFFVEGVVAGYVVGVVLWPMCVWQLGGRYVWHRMVRGRRNVT